MAKMGRPTDNPKPYRVVIRIDQECRDILDAYMEENGMSQVDVIRYALKRLNSEQKKKK